MVGASSTASGGRFACGVLVALLACTHTDLVAQKAAPGTVVEGDLGIRLDSLVANKAPGFWGAVLVAVDGKPVLAKGYGMADRQKVPNGPQSVFDLGGAAQQFTAFLALRLVAEGKLQLDTPVGQFVENWPVEKAAITIDHLLRHTSGLPVTAAFTGAAAVQSKAALQVLAQTPLAALPGAAASYSGLNGNLLALVSEAALAGRFDKLLVDRVCKPLGMATAGPCNGRFDARLVTYRRSPADERGVPATAFEYQNAQRGAVGFLASVLDVHAHLVALTGGKVLDDTHLTLLWRPLEGVAHGVTHLPGNGDTMIRVHGQTDGYRARWLVHRALRRWIVILTEDYRDPGPLETALVAATMEPTATAKPVAAAGGAPPVTDDGWPTAAIERWVGTFELPRGGGSFTIRRDGAGLSLCGEGLQASARLEHGLWPPYGEARLRSAEDRGLRILEQLLAADASFDRAGFAEPEQGAAARGKLLEWKTQNGPTVAVRLIGTRLDPPFQPPGSAESWFRLSGKGKDLVIRVPWADAARFRRVEPTDDVPPFRLPLQYARTDVAFTDAGSRQRLVLSMEGVGDKRCLVFEDGSAGTQGLLECPLRQP